MAKVGPEIRERLEALGRERALIYKTLVLTGLRKAELASLTVGQLHLDGPAAYVELDAADEKNREGNAVPIRADLADDLRSWLADKLADVRKAAKRPASPSRPDCRGRHAAVHVPDGLVRILDRDLRLAGIPKRDDRGRTLDVHALRTTFGTLLSKGGVPSARTGSSRHAAFRPVPDRQRLHRPAVARHPRGIGRAADPATRRRAGRGPRVVRATGTAAWSACTAACTNLGKPVQTGQLLTSDRPTAIGRTRPTPQAPVLHGKSRSVYNSCQRSRCQYARQELNLQPLAPEANALSN